MLFSAVSSLTLLVGCALCQLHNGGLKDFACAFNQRLYPADSPVTTFRYASPMKYQFLRLDHTLFAIEDNRCTSLDGENSILCRVDQWSELNTIIFQIENITHYREISLHSMYQQGFDTISFQSLPHRNGSDAYFVYNGTTVFDICPTSDEVELTWRIHMSMFNEFVVECWHHEIKICSIINFSLDGIHCDVEHFGEYMHIKFNASRSVKPIDNYYCTINGRQALSKTVYWQGALHYRPLNKHGYHEGSEYDIASLDEERTKHLSDIFQHRFVEEEFLRNDGDHLFVAEDSANKIESGYEEGQKCSWQKGIRENGMTVLTGYCRLNELSDIMQEEQVYENSFNGSLEVTNTQRFMYHELDGSVNDNEAMLYWILDTRRGNITCLTCSTNNGSWTYSGLHTDGSDLYLKVVDPLAIYVLRATSPGTSFMDYSCTLDKKFVLRKRVYWQVSSLDANLRPKGDP